MNKQTPPENISWFRRVFNVVFRRKIGDKILDFEKFKRWEAAQREKEFYDYLRSGGSLAFRIIVYPEYGKDERLQVDRECGIPPESLYLPLGWDEFPTQRRKHYRKFFPDELENVLDVMPKKSPFDSYLLKKG